MEINPFVFYSQENLRWTNISYIKLHDQRYTWESDCQTFWNYFNKLRTYNQRSSVLHNKDQFSSWFLYVLVTEGVSVFRLPLKTTGSNLNTSGWPTCGQASRKSAVLHWKGGSWSYVGPLMATNARSLNMAALVNCNTDTYCSRHNYTRDLTT